MKRVITAALSMATLFGVARFSVAEEWPKWLGPKGTGISAESGLLETWPEDGPKKLWSHDVGIGYSSPVALDGRVYIFTQNERQDLLFCFDAESGKEIWNQSYQRGEDPAYPGTRATPTIDGDKIYTHGSGGDLVCRQLADGKLLWQTNILKQTSAKPIQWGSSSSPLVTEEYIFVQGGMEGDATAVCVDKKTGSIVWKSEAKTLAGYASLILADAGSQKQLIVFAGDMLYGMDPRTGKTLWSEAWKTDYDVNAATPIFHDSKILVTSTRNFGVMMMTLSSDGKATKDWEKKDIACKFQPPILDGTTLYANSNGILKAISWPDGATLWSAAGRDLNVGAGGSILRVGDKLITMSERGKLSLVLATPKEGKLISQVQLFDYTQVWSMPVIYRGKLYAKGEKEFVCLDISK